MKLSVLLTVLVVSTVWAQPIPELLWCMELGGPYEDASYCVQQASDGGYIIAGETNFEYNADCYLVKVDQESNVLWTRSFGGEGYDKANSILQTPNGDFIVACAKDYHYWLVRTYFTGDTIWTRLGPEGSAYDVQLDNDGGYVVFGYIVEPVPLRDDYMLSKYNMNDSLVWRRIYNNPGVDYGMAVSPTMDGGYIMVGRHYDMDPNESNGYVVKSDSMGNMLWDYSFGTGGWASGVVETPEGDYVIAGLNTGGIPNHTRAVVIKLEADGDSIWFKTFDRYIISQARDVRLTSDSGYIITGLADPAGSQVVFLLFKMNSDGDTLWSRIYYAPGQHATATSGIQTNDSEYVMTGYCQGMYEDRDIFLVKTGPDGGSALPLGAYMNLPSDYVLHPVYPNPFNSMAVIKYEMPVTGVVRVGAYDVLGRKVATLIDEQVRAGSHQVVWDSWEMSSGVYFVQMAAEDFRQARKVVLLK